MKKYSRFPLLAVYLIIFSVGLIIFIFFKPNFNKLCELRAHYSFAKQKLLLEERKNIFLQKEYNGLSTDPNRIEEVAREKLGWCRPTETVIRFQTQSQNNKASNSNK